MYILSLSGITSTKHMRHLNLQKKIKTQNVVLNINRIDFFKWGIVIFKNFI